MTAADRELIAPAVETPRNGKAPDSDGAVTTITAEPGGLLPFEELWAGSAYYREKFLGLAHHFDGGCRIVDIDQPGWLHGLQASIEAARASAHRSRPAILRAAREQIRAGAALVPTLRAVLRRGTAQAAPQVAAVGSASAAGVRFGGP